MVPYSERHTGVFTLTLWYLAVFISVKVYILQDSVEFLRLAGTVYVEAKYTKEAKCACPQYEEVLEWYWLGDSRLVTFSCWLYVSGVG